MPLPLVPLPDETPVVEPPRGALTAAIKFYISTTIEVMNQQGRPDSKMIPRRPQSDSPRTGDGHPLVARQNYAPEQIRQAAANFRALSDPERLRLTAFLVSGQGSRRCPSA